jgi:predicted site-specific integrase-resolvase
MDRNIEIAATLLEIKPDILQRWMKEKDERKTPPSDYFMKPRDVAKTLGISIRTLSNWFEQGKLTKKVVTDPHQRSDGRMCGGSVRVLRSDVDYILQNGIREEKDRQIRKEGSRLT